MLAPDNYRRCVTSLRQYFVDCERVDYVFKWAHPRTRPAIGPEFYVTTKGMSTGESLNKNLNLPGQHEILAWHNDTCVTGSLLHSWRKSDQSLHLNWRLWMKDRLLLDLAYWCRFGAWISPVNLNLCHFRACFMVLMTTNETCRMIHSICLLREARSITSRISEWGFQTIYGGVGWAGAMGPDIDTHAWTRRMQSQQGWLGCGHKKSLVQYVIHHFKYFSTRTSYRIFFIYFKPEAKFFGNKDFS